VNTVFLDTVGLIALWDETDQWHKAAQQAYAEIRKLRFRGVTTAAVLLECGNAAARRPYRQHVNLLRLQMAAKNRLIELTDEEWQFAWEAYNRNEAAGAGIVDQSSFVVMRRLGLRTAFTNDSHFTAAGFETLF
jgi:predicted nucleic acid-binding protein